MHVELFGWACRDKFVVMTTNDFVTAKRVHALRLPKWPWQISGLPKSILNWCHHNTDDCNGFHSWTISIWNPWFGLDSKHGLNEVNSLWYVSVLQLCPRQTTPHILRVWVFNYLSTSLCWVAEERFAGLNGQLLALSQLRPARYKQATHDYIRLNYNMNYY